MADKTEVSAKCIVKSIYDKAQTNAVQAAMGKSIQNAVNKSSGFKYVSKTNKGFMLTVTLVSLTKNDKNELEAKIAISGMYIGGTAKAFNASAGGKAQGVDPDELVGDVLDDMMGKVIKTMDGLKP
jgi:hypothetical protein